MEQHKLTPRQWALKRWLEENHEPGKFHSILEVCRGVRFTDGSYCYEFNTDPYKHDKCIALSNDVREINWSVGEGYKLIIKDKSGGVKLCESKEEFEEWRKKELEPLDKKWKYLNNMKYKADRDGIVPLINQNNRVIEIDNETADPISVFM